MFGLTTTQINKQSQHKKLKTLKKIRSNKVLEVILTLMAMTLPIIVEQELVESRNESYIDVECDSVRLNARKDAGEEKVVKTRGERQTTLS